MKLRIIASSIFLLTSVASAQILLNDVGFFKTGSGGTAVGGKVEFWQNSAGSKTGTLKLYVSNFSDYKKYTNVLTGYEDAVLTGFGFNVGTGFTYKSSSFTQAITGPIAGWETASEPNGITFTRSSNFTAGGELFEQGAFASNPVLQEGLSGGYSALFTFQFTASTASFLTSNFNANKFFGDADLKDLYFKFQEVSSGGCAGTNTDEIYVGFPSGDIPPTPEPSTYGMIGAALLVGLVAHRKYRSKKSA